MKKILKLTLLILIGFSQIKAASTVKITVNNHSDYELQEVRLMPTKIVKIGATKGTLEVEGKNFSVPVPKIGTPHGANFQNIAKNGSQSKDAKLYRFDISKIKVTYKNRKKSKIRNKLSNQTRRYRIGRFKDCKYTKVKRKLKVPVGISRYSGKINSINVDIYNDSVSFTVSSKDYK